MPTPDPVYREVPLTKGLVAIVDAEDFALVSSHKWYAMRSYKELFYAARKIRVEGRAVTVLMHRSLLGLRAGDALEVDHANRNSLDNRRTNIRTCTSSQNKANRVLASSSGSKGVSWSRERNMWQSHISINGKTQFLGRFHSLEEASLAYRAAAIGKFGEFTRIY
jgi:hypothetical protein